VAKTSFKTVDEYIASRPPNVQRVLKRVRRILQNAIPNADETISYQMPAFKIHGRAVVYFAGWTEHYALYPAGSQLPAEFKDALSKYEVSKGTIRFPLTEPVPVSLIERIARFRAVEAARAQKKGTKKG
jgi:uncharacterized protein YdhG (YjbR/CyaY superfamily)